MLARMWRTGKNSPLLVEYKLTEPLWKSVFPQNCGSSEYWESIYLKTSYIVLRNLSKSCSTLPQGHCSTMFISYLFTLDRNWKQPRGTSTEEWIIKNVVHLCNGVSLNCIFFFKWHREFMGKWMQLKKKKNPPKWGNPYPERQTQHAFTYKWIFPIR